MRAKAVKSIREFPIRVFSFLVIKGLKCIVKLPDAALIKIIGWAAAYSKKRNHGNKPTPLMEVSEMLIKDPNMTKMIRRFLLDSRESQFFSIVKGMIKHHALAEDKSFEIYLPGISHKKISVDSRQICVGLVGDGFDARMLHKAYEENENCRCSIFTEEQIGGVQKIAAIADGLEITRRLRTAESLVSSALEQGVAVSIHHSAIESPDMLQRLINQAEHTRTSLRIFYPYFYYPPIQKAKELLADDMIGEVTTIHIRATIGGKGGSLEPEIPDPEKYFDHPAFDHFILLAFFGGAFEKAVSYLNRMDPKYGGQGLVDCKFEYPGRYGLLECSFAPEMYIRSDHYPYDLDVEIAGTDGILWLQRGMAKRVQSPPITIRAGKQYCAFGVGSGLREDWEESYKNAADHFADMVRGNCRRVMQNKDIFSALELKAKIFDVAQSSKAVNL